jgi:hypothetical protein
MNPRYTLLIDTEEFPVFTNDLGDAGRIGWDYVCGTGAMVEIIDNVTGETMGELWFGKGFDPDNPNRRRAYIHDECYVEEER